jgi:hypothetical protein
LIRARPRFRDASERAVSRIGIRAEAFSVSARAMLRAPSRATPSRVVAARSNRHRRRHRVGARASARETPKNGERVTLHYKMTLNDGTVIDDTRSDARQGQPVTITLGDDSLFARIGEELATMTPGDVRENVTLAAKDAFGERDDAKVQRFPLSPEEAQSMASQVQVGQLVQLPDGARAVPGARWRERDARSQSPARGARFMLRARARVHRRGLEHFRHAHGVVHPASARVALT